MYAVVHTVNSLRCCSLDFTKEESSSPQIETNEFLWPHMSGEAVRCAPRRQVRGLGKLCLHDGGTVLNTMRSDENHGLI